jgi:hypothetical protein
LWIYLEFVFENRIMKLVEIVLRNEGDERWRRDGGKESN